MPILQSYRITASGTETITIPKATIEALILDVDGVTVLRDFTGANGFTLGQALNRMTNAQLRVLADQLANDLLYRAAGISP